MIRAPGADELTTRAPEGMASFTTSKVMAPLVIPSIESLVPYEGGKPIEELARELGVENAVKLASNENALGPSPLAIEAARAVLGTSHRYPDGAC